MLEIIVKSEKTRIEKTSKGNELRQQQCAIDQGTDYPLAFWLTVDQPYKPGRYTLSEGSFLVNPFGGLELRRYGLQLVPLGNA